ncbi:MAG TPA: GNAT family N-acetyltransferase [Candidatus Binatia bacterium]|nr:GNAT family N-acetyltransferase [Candidatus Binatia bacterium]
MHAEWTNDRFTVSTDRARLDIGVIHSFLSERAYWALGRSREAVARTIEHSLCFGLFDEAAQVGFARVVTDYAIFAYLCDVFVIESHRGCGLSKWLLRCVLSHPAMTGIRRFHLLTNDAHTLYQQLGFTALASPERHMELVALSPAPDPKR